MWAVLAEHELIIQCVAGSAEAWTELYLRFHDRMLRTIEMTVAPVRDDPELVDEIAARVWYTMVRDDQKMLRAFDGDRGASFSTYLSIVAKSIALQYFRSERRRRRREHTVSKSIDSKRVDEPMQTLDFQDVFLTSLSPQERRFYDEHLVASVDQNDECQDGSDRSYSIPYAWQLRHRVFVKLRDYMEGEAEQQGNPEAK